jgi:hypothetical protein
MSLPLPYACCQPTKLQIELHKIRQQNMNYFPLKFNFFYVSHQTLPLVQAEGFVVKSAFQMSVHSYFWGGGGQNCHIAAV